MVIMCFDQNENTDHYCYPITSLFVFFRYFAGIG